MSSSLTTPIFINDLACKQRKISSAKDLAMILDMDLTLKQNNFILNIRVAILLKTPKGYLFEVSKDGFIFLIGGRVAALETSLDAAKRETYEEVDLKINNFKLTGIIENFFSWKDEKYHEINFLYSAEIEEELDLQKLNSQENRFVCVDKDSVNNFDIKPKVIVNILGESEKFWHLINDDMV